MTVTMATTYTQDSHKLPLKMLLVSFAPSKKRLDIVPTNRTTSTSNTTNGADAGAGAQF